MYRWPFVVSLVLLLAASLNALQKISNDRVALS